jgi:hypothetical protein
MAGDVAVDQAAAAVLNDDEHRQQAKRCGDGAGGNRMLWPLRSVFINNSSWLYFYSMGFKV